MPECVTFSPVTPSCVTVESIEHECVSYASLAGVCVSTTEATPVCVEPGEVTAECVLLADLKVYQGEILLEELDSVDFGLYSFSDEEKLVVLTLKNIGSGSLVIGTITVSGVGFSIVTSLSGSVIGPNQTVDATLRFSGLLSVATVTGSLSIESNDLSSPYDLVLVVSAKWFGAVLTYELIDSEVVDSNSDWTGAVLTFSAPSDSQIYSASYPNWSGATLSFDSASDTEIYDSSSSWSGSTGTDL